MSSLRGRPALTLCRVLGRISLPISCSDILTNGIVDVTSVAALRLHRQLQAAAAAARGDSDSDAGAVSPTSSTPGGDGLFSFVSPLLAAGVGKAKTDEVLVASPVSPGSPGSTGTPVSAFHAHAAGLASPVGRKPSAQVSKTTPMMLTPRTRRSLQHASNLELEEDSMMSLPKFFGA